LFSRQVEKELPADTGVVAVIVLQCPKQRELENTSGSIQKRWLKISTFIRVFYIYCVIISYFWMHDSTFNNTFSFIFCFAPSVEKSKSTVRIATKHSAPAQQPVASQAAHEDDDTDSVTEHQQHLKATFKPYENIDFLTQQLEQQDLREEESLQNQQQYIICLVIAIST
jgi:hypothetical protein